jgi:AcrR family transcriptional regulator
MAAGENLRARRKNNAHARQKNGSSDHERQRKTVQRVAESLFSRCGYSGTSVHTVAARAHCSVGHLYNLYGSKLGLYRALLEAKLTHVAEISREVAASEASAEERCRLLLNRTLEFFDQNLAFLRVFESETEARFWRINRTYVERIRSHRIGFLQLLARLVREGQERGEFRRDLDPDSVATSLFGLVRSQATYWSWCGREGRLLDQADGIFKLIMFGLKSDRERA